MDLFKKEETPTSNKKTKSSKNEPLATRMRPRSLNEFVGQKHIVGEGKLLRRMIESGVIGSLIFYGPPSSGKTTLAHVISLEADAQFVVLNAVLDGIKDLREVVEKAEKLQQLNGQKTILFVDEIHRWNKAQQDALLPHLESGMLTLIGATTENPFYSLVNPLLSRCQLFELFDLTKDDVKTMINRSLNDKERGLGDKKINITDDAVDHLAKFAGGDIRNAINALEVAVLSSEPDQNGTIHINFTTAKESIQKRNVRYQKGGDEHYHYASAFIKSMRGSDVDAALYWMAAMLEGGDDPQFIFRRMLILASEDVGMADPQALPFVNSAHEAFTKCGLPEGLYFLAHACIYLALAPKSNSTSAIFKARRYVADHGIKPPPPYLQDQTANTKQAQHFDTKNASDDYKYAHSFKNHWVDQQYLPDGVNLNAYEAGNIGKENELWQRLQQIKNEFTD